MPGRMYAVGEKGPRKAIVEIDPQPCSRETRMPDGAGAGQRPAGPVFIWPFPAMGAFFGKRRAHQRHRLITFRVTRKKPCREIEHRIGRAEQPGMPRTLKR